MLHHTLYKSNCESDRFVVLLHGFGGNCKVWKYQIPILQKFCNVLTIDLPSHYEGYVKLTALEDSCIEGIVKEIIAVLDEYSIQNATFMGLSLGTVFVKYIEAYYPKYIKDAILVGALGTVGVLLHIVVNVFAKIGDKLPPMAVYKLFSKVIMPWKVSKYSREVFCDCAKALTADEFKAYMRIFKEHFKFNKLFVKGKHHNNIYVTGIGDLCFVKGIRKEAEKLGAKLALMKSCGHVCNIDQRDGFNNLMIDVIRGSVEQECVVSN